MSSLRKAVVIGTIPLRRIQDMQQEARYGDAPETYSISIDDELNQAVARLDSIIKKLDEDIAKSKQHTIELESTRSRTMESIRRYLDSERERYEYQS